MIFKIKIRELNVIPTFAQKSYYKMKEQIKNIEFGKGIGALVFGQSRKEVEAILGKPSEVERYYLSEEDDDETEAWHYDNLFLSLSFDEEHNWKLSSVAVSSDFYIINGQSLIGKSKDEVFELFEKNQWGEPVEDPEVSQDAPGSSLYHVDYGSLSLWFEGEELTEIQLGPLLDNENIIWP